LEKVGEAFQDEKTGFVQFDNGEFIFDFEILNVRKIKKMRDIIHKLINTLKKC
jgi:ribose 5-phosphate isomerase